MVSVDNAAGFAEALARIGAEHIGPKAVDAIRRFAVSAGQKLCDNSPLAVRPVRNRGLFLANWRASLRMRNPTPIDIPDPIGAQTVAAIERVVNSGPTELDSWPWIVLTNPHPSGEEIEQRFGVVKRTVRELESEASA